MIALSISFVGPPAMNGEEQGSSDGATQAQLTIESAAASVQVTYAVSPGQPAPAGIEPMGPANGGQSFVPPAQVEDGKEQPAEVQLPASPISSEQPAGTSEPTINAEPQAAMDTATLLSGMPLDGEAQLTNEPLRAAIDHPLTNSPSSNREASSTTDLRQSDGYSTPDVIVEQRALPEWSQSDGGQHDAMGQHGEQAPGGRTESPGTTHHAVPRDAFGDTVSALTAERTAQGEATGSRSSSPSGTVRAVSMWSGGDEPLPVVQTVSFNLEPADLGPVNVRIFMSDRTVHAHIRTDHMDFGQGMLNQQQQLETKLQSSGFEVGEFKVTVDQQQLSRGDSQGWLAQHDDQRAARADSRERALERPVREPVPAERRRHTGIVSFLA
ncbi:MAG TPA: flagellar hook-length control protein FliK [Nitrospiraceae bacterium]|nr:flagellar hook-length control protein FliK [Nitrospiraceae bacterium]